ncbi:serine/threonine-protein phosphatase 6 regulatory ankyrin repeat subunit A-like [Phymastichus coffea]|uniref:serine/threonine-protein phosphatase 6 regulatory ankyrin repeat subunit A-like n=1 Tax=Phymastichus coffea TaxID=108790 RepID=UPI00273B2B30|nr:serine/threonine-protein phosphatase 6 regulatory ankyrin repeat subunit A-like [Phymastichus coffea]
MGGCLAKSRKSSGASNDVLIVPPWDVVNTHVFLRRAVINGELDRVEELLAQKPDLNNRAGGLLIWRALENDDTEIASLLVDAGAYLDVRNPWDNSNSSILHLLVQSNNRNHQRLAVQIMEHGAVDLNARDEFQLTVLHRTLEASSPIIMIKELLRHRVEVHGTPIIQATVHVRSSELLNLLVSEFLSTGFRNRRIEELLIRCGTRTLDDADVVPLVKMLLNEELPVAWIDHLHFVLIHAIRGEKIRMVKLLVEYGFNVNARASDEELPQHFHQIDVKIPGEMPLGAAAQSYQPEITRILLEAGAEVNTRMELFRYGTGYPLHGACAMRSSANILLLLHYGADVNLLDDEGQTAFSRIVYVRTLNKSHQLLIAHFVLLIKMGEVVNVMDLESIQSNDDMKSFYDKCLNELETMDRLQIIPNVPFSLFFGRNTGELAFRLRSEYFLQRYYEMQRSKRFPIYAEEMHHRFEIAEIRRRQLNVIEEIIYAVLLPYLPNIPLERIIHFFYMHDSE